MFGLDRGSVLSGGCEKAARILRGRGRHMECAAYMGLATAILGAMMLCGCGSTSSRQSIQGTVTLDGKPLEKGQITFVPQADTRGPTAGAEISGGNFSIPTAGGTFAGKFRVEITASRLSGQKAADRFTGKPVDSFEQFIPRRYNTESRLTADVKAGTENRFEFATSSK
jgi:hypothetical protein